MLRSIILKKYIDDPIEEIIWHNPVVYIRDMIFTFFLLTVSYALWLFVDKMIPENSNVWLVFWIIWLILLIRFCINFLNNYLDALVVTQNWLVIYRREGLLEYKTEIFERSKVELISYEQSSLMDKVFIKWDIVISLDYNTAFTFENISNPQKKVGNILMAKRRNQQQYTPEFHEEPNSQKFDILVETLGEVIQDYMKKDKKPEEHQER